MTGPSRNPLSHHLQALLLAIIPLLVCSCYAPRRGHPPKMPPLATPPQQLCIIIDDAGQRLDQIEPFLAIPAPLTIAILPDLPATRRTAQATHIAAPEKQLILHQPMEALNEKLNPGPGAIRSSTTPEQISTILQHNIAQIPGVQGMNNHMGSRITQNREQLDATMEFCKENGLFFVDSLTTPDSIAQQVAQEHGVPSTQRYIFLDNNSTPEAIREQFLKGMQIAKRNGFVVMIGHAWSPETAHVIAEMVPAAHAANYSFHRVSDIVR